MKQFTVAVNVSTLVTGKLQESLLVNTWLLK